MRHIYIHVMKCMALMLLAVAGTNAKITGCVDVSKAGTGKVTVVLNNGTSTGLDKNGCYSLATTGIQRSEAARGIKPEPGLAWKDLGKSVKLINGNANNYVVDAYSFDGKQVVSGAKFVNGVAVIGTGKQMLYTRLRTIAGGGTQLPATRVFADSAVKDSARTDTTTKLDSTKHDSTQHDSTSVVAKVVFIVTTCDSVCHVDTLAEIPVTSWDTVLATKYVVQRNVKVTLPTKYAAADSVKCGWYNVFVNPKNYFTISLSNYKGRKWSGYIYSTYDSASYGADSYLYSAVALVKKKDSVIAFSDSIARVTAHTGDVEFDSTDLVNKIVSRPLADTAIVPWYAFTVNKSSVNVALNRVMKLDSVVSYSDSLFNWEVMRLTKDKGVDTSVNKLDIAFAYDMYSDSSHTESDTGITTQVIDSIRVLYTPDTSVTDTATGKHTATLPRIVTVAASVQTSIAFKVDRKNDFGKFWTYDGAVQVQGHYVDLRLPGATSANIAETAKVYFVRKKTLVQYK